MNLKIVSLKLTLQITRLLFVFILCALFAQSEAVIVCTLNLHNFGKERGEKFRSLKASLLAERIVNGKCDIVGVQEISAKRTDFALKLCSLLTSKLEELTFSSWDCIVGDATEGEHRPGFVFKKKFIELVKAYSLRNVELPKLVDLDKPSSFQRVPLQADFKVKFTNTTRALTILNIHFKSKAGAKDDPLDLKWETVRMEQAEGLRQYVEKEILKSQKLRVPVLILGDRNSDFSSPSFKILTGQLKLEDFKGKAPCRVSKSLRAVCLTEIEREPNFVSATALNRSVITSGGTFFYKKKGYFFDDILIDVYHSELVKKRQFSTQDWHSGIVWEPAEASDHALVWAKLVWR